MSHAREDTARIQPILRALKEQALSVWWDGMIPVGESWRREIARALERARCVVVVWTPASIGSEFVIEEAGAAKRSGRLVPCRFERAEPPIGFGEMQFAELSEWDGTTPNEALTPLFGTIERLCGRRARQRSGLPSKGERVGEFQVVAPGSPSRRTRDAALAFRAFEMRHALLSNRRVRGKFYSLACVAPPEQSRFRARVHRHAEVLAKIGSHPNIHAITAYFEDQDRDGIWVFEDWVDGETIEERLARASPERIDPVAPMRGVLEALHALHRNDYFVRDLGPDSVVLERQTLRAVVTNFELAKDDSGGASVSSGSTFRGSPYTAPELRKGSSSGSAAGDLFSWGAVLCALATGRHFEDRRIRQTLEELRRLKVPSKCVRLVEECLDPFKSRRPLSAAVALKRLT